MLNLDDSKKCSVSIDLGGTTSKLLIYSKNNNLFEKLKEEDIKWQVNKLGDYFYYFLHKNDPQDVEIVTSILLVLIKHEFKMFVGVTGGGSENFITKIKQNDELNSHILSLKESNEINSLMNGLKIIKTHFPERFISLLNSPELPSQFYPCILINIGSGSSIVHINEEGVLKRIGGTCIGASTFIGLSILSESQINEDNTIRIPSKEFNFKNLAIETLNNLQIYGKPLNLNKLSKDFDLGNPTNYNLYVLVNILRENFRMALYQAKILKVNTVLMAGSVFNILSKDIKCEGPITFLDLLNEILKLVKKELKIPNSKIYVINSKGLLGCFGSMHFE